MALLEGRLTTFSFGENINWSHSHIRAARAQVYCKTPLISTPTFSPKSAAGCGAPKVHTPSPSPPPNVCTAVSLNYVHLLKHVPKRVVYGKHWIKQTSSWKDAWLRFIVPPPPPLKLSTSSVTNPQSMYVLIAAGGGGGGSTNDYWTSVWVMYARAGRHMTNASQPIREVSR